MLGVSVNEMIESEDKKGMILKWDNKEMNTAMSITTDPPSEWKIDSGIVALKGQMRYYVDGSVYCGHPVDLDCSYDVRIINHKGDALVSNLQYTLLRICIKRTYKIWNFITYKKFLNFYT